MLNGPASSRAQARISRRRRDPPDRSPAFWAFRAYRNYDGKGGRFLDWLVPASSAYGLSSVFASRNESGDRMVLVLLNLDPQGPLDARLETYSMTVLEVQLRPARRP